MITMKKIVVAIVAGAMATFSVQAQEIPERKRDGKGIHERHGKMHHRPGGMEFQKLNLTDAQKEQMKVQRESFRKQMDELKKNENITVKEWKTRMENLRKEQKTKMESILTTEQKAQLEKMKTEHKALHEVDAKARLEKMKIHLGLTDDQAAKIEKNRKEMAEKMKAIRENKSLGDEKKREEMKELMKKQKENMKSVLTEEQLKKMQDLKRPVPGRPDGPGKKYGQKTADKEVI
jgi:Spy/CpxP family protein refolding chaperone